MKIKTNVKAGDDGGILIWIPYVGPIDDKPPRNETP